MRVWRVRFRNARQDAANRNDVPAAGNGYVAAFDLSGRMLSNLVAQGPLNSPWGLTIAPPTFADFANALLVGNSGDGRINAFDPATGAWKGALADAQNNPVASPGFTPSISGVVAPKEMFRPYTLLPVFQVRTVPPWDRTDCSAAYRPRRFSGPTVY